MLLPQTDMRTLSIEVMLARCTERLGREPATF